MAEVRLMADFQSSEKPRERFLSVGANQLSTEEILAILLRTGYKGCSVLELAKQVINLFRDGESGLGQVTPDKLISLKGIGRDKAVTVCAALELGRRMSQLRAKCQYVDFSQPDAVAQYVMERLRYEKEENFCVALLNTKNKLIGIETVSKGGLSSSLAEQRAVFRYAIEANAAAIILLHNHPSGDATASPDDVTVTKTFIKAGKVMGIPVLDHVIIGDGEYVSLFEKGYL